MKLSCRDIAEEFQVGKTQAVNVIKLEAQLRTEYEKFQGKGFKHLQRQNHKKYKVKKYGSSGIFVHEPLLKEEDLN